MRCRCGAEISATRLAVLPRTTVCARCSTEKPVLVFTAYSGKNTSDVFIVNPDNKEDVRQAFRAYKRSR